MFYRLFLTFLIVYFFVKAVRSRFRRPPIAPTDKSKKRTELDPESIRDAEFTEVRDSEENRK